LDLIETRLLVGPVESRAGSEEIYSKLQGIEAKCTVDLSYLFMGMDEHETD
jgi:hypothetical protein